MGESSACLVRSFSAGTSTEPKEGDSLRALTTSISFGRFTSESLDWEKWSCFSNNRYLEEAEKSSKPGSVAEKKAYFEAHYKRIAAKKAAALLEEQILASNELDLPELDNVDDTHDCSLAVLVPSKSDSPKTDVVLSTDENVRDTEVEGNKLEIEEMEEAETATEQLNMEENSIQVELVLSADENVRDPEVEGNKLEIEEMEEAEIATEQLNMEENCIQVELINRNDDVEIRSKIVSSQQEKMATKGSSHQGNSSSTSKNKRSIRSPSSFTNIRVSKLRSSVKLSPVQASKEDYVTQTCKKAASQEKKKSALKSLHMSINFSSRASETSKTLPIIHEVGNSKSVKNFGKAYRDIPTHPQIPTRASVNRLSVPRPETNLPLPERRRSKTLDDCSGSGSRTAVGKSQSSSIDHLKSSGASGNKGRPPITTASFNFRCEERAAKRKEKLEKKLNAEVENVCLQAKSKEIADNFLKVRQSTDFIAKPVPCSHRGTESPHNHMKKIPLPRPQSPKLGRKKTPSMVKDTGSLPPWRSSVNIDGSKPSTPKSNRKLFDSMNSVLRKNTHENASPNIQL
ncbi:hypothetical protein Vadar_020132 [Vaccinium darrowii]|uniref:Uncharacterized protein n=1 Tax=Vaccinium darrowii TaxID=229202 RepID=A0ACB7YXX9_9ERIC|nr:hypothetical protein Vadar_020132 [Vaccinium darrowii]